MRFIVAALLVCSVSEALAQSCDSTDMRENMKFCTISAEFYVKSQFCRELKGGDVQGAIDSMDACEKNQGDHDKIMQNARNCGSQAVFNALREFSGNLGCSRRKAKRAQM